jgi:hypothetical protein
MLSSDNQFSAAEQALGYLYQLRYALLQTLRLPEETACFIEKDDDIGDGYNHLILYGFRGCIGY